MPGNHRHAQGRGSTAPEGGPRIAPTAPDQRTKRQLSLTRWLVVFGAVSTAVNVAIAATATWLTPERGTRVFILTSVLVGAVQAVAGAVLLQRRALK